MKQEEAEQEPTPDGEWGRTKCLSPSSLSACVRPPRLVTVTLIVCSLYVRTAAIISYLLSIPQRRPCPCPSPLPSSTMTGELCLLAADNHCAPVQSPCIYFILLNLAFILINSECLNPPSFHIHPLLSSPPAYLMSTYNDPPLNSIDA